ncbi:MAG: formate-dependent phosphoribosylglycinamide formyltransferase [Georgfuchsia sp.]
MRIGTPLSPSATRVMLLGSGELGKEVIIALQRLGCEVIAVDRYPDAPGMQVAHRSHVIAMTDGAALRALIETEKPHLVVPEIEAIATDVLIEIEKDGLAEVIPTARAARLTMNREGIRRLAAEELKLPTSPYRFADSLAELQAAIDGDIGYPCIVKPVMSSSGKGQSLIRTPSDVQKAWDYSQAGGRAGAGRIIVEGFIDFDYEITQLTVRAAGESGTVETFFCEPIGHVQVAGDYVESWQPMAMSPTALARSREIAQAITSNLGLPVDVSLRRPGASAVIYGGLAKKGIAFEGIEKALAVPESDLRLFGKPESFLKRRMGVAVANADTTDEARTRAKYAASQVRPISA